MKKFMYFLPIAALAMASCSNDDSPVQSVQEQLSGLTDQLVLRPTIQGASTRVVQAYSNGDNSFKEFYLTATGNFRDNESSTAANLQIVHNIDDFVTNQDGSSWLLKSGKSYWWNDSDTKGTFTGYAPKTEVEAAVADYTEIDNDRSKQIDYILAYNEGLKADFRAGVPLRFRHTTSQIAIQALNKDVTKVNITVKAARMVNIMSTGKLSLPTVSTADGFDWANYTPWNIQGDKMLTYSSFDGATSIPSSVVPLAMNGTAQSILFGDNQYLLPQQLTPATVKDEYKDPAFTWDEDVVGHAIAFLIKVVDPSKDSASDPNNYYIYPLATSPGITSTNPIANAYAWAYVPVNTNWEPGKKYIYTINFAKDAYGKVDPDQEPGGTPDPADPKNPGDDIVDTAVPLTFDVSIVDWEEVNEAVNP